MMFQRLAASAVALACAFPACADVIVHDAYARAAMPNAPTGAAFMVLENTGSENDRLIDAASDVAMRVELHTHIDDGNGVMQMRQVVGGIELIAGQSHALERGGDHVMFMGLTRPLVQGETVPVTLTFEKAGEITIDIPVDLTR